MQFVYILACIGVVFIASNTIGLTGIGGLIVGLICIGLLYACFGTKK